MTRSLRDLLHRGIDYSGMFPPASLTAEAAVAEYLELTSGPYQWMLHRFSVPAATLLDPTLAPLGEEPVAVIGRNTGKWYADRAEDADDLNVYANRGGRVMCYECLAPPTEDFTSGLKALQGFHAADEVLVELNPQEPFPMILDALADADAFGAKLRTGPTPPPSDIVANFIWECVALELPFKLTAGLHHPLTTSGQLGFMNVLAGTALALANDLSAKEIEVILGSADASDWRLSDSVIAFNDWEATRDDIADAKALFASFGSCSVLEPVQELNALGWYA